MNKTGVCKLCGDTGNTEWHHIVYKSRCKALENCKYNLVELCVNCHRGDGFGVHHNKNTDEVVKTKLRKYLEKLIYITGDKARIQELEAWLGISEKEVNKLCKTLKRYGEKISIEELIINIGLGGL